MTDLLAPVDKDLLKRIKRMKVVTDKTVVVKAPVKKAKPKKAKAKKVAPDKVTPTRTKWAVRIRNHHTGQTITLGVRYDTRKAAEANATDEHVCHRCNSVDVVPASEGDYMPASQQLGYELGTRRGTGMPTVRKSAGDGISPDSIATSIRAQASASR